MFVKDTAGRYRLANAAHRRQLGLGSSEELAHRTVIDMAPGDWARREADEDREVIESGTPVLDREQEIQLGIERIRLVTSKVPVTEPGGVVVGLVGVTRDVTTTREAEEARRIIDQQLQETQKLESLGVLAGGIAHDFNNLLTGVLGQHQPCASPARQPGRRPPRTWTASRRPPCGRPTSASRCWPTPARGASTSSASTSER